MPNCQIGFSTLAKPHFSLFIFSVKVVVESCHWNFGPEHFGPLD